VSNFEYYLCSNGGFMKSITDGLEAWGVPRRMFVSRHSARDGEKENNMTPPKPLSSKEGDVGRSEKPCTGDVSGNLLDSWSQGVRIDSGCCAGSCGSAGRDQIRRCVTQSRMPNPSRACLTASAAQPI
jgi:hypothetical protein